MDLIQQIRDQAKSLNRSVVLPESEDIRTLHCAVKLASEKIAKPILIGDTTSILAQLKDLNLSSDGISIIDPSTDANRTELASLLHSKRQHKGMTLDQAMDFALDPLWYSALLVEAGHADGMVAGAVNSTGDVLRAGFQVIGTAQDCSVVSSCFVMYKPDWEFGDNGQIVFADCAVNPNPSAEQLADIAIATSKTAAALCRFEPSVAMLSYSTGDSGVGEDVEKVKDATAIAHNNAPDLKVDGPLQADAAILQAVARKKAPESKVAGNANILVFPDLNSGNIAYKLVQRMAGAAAIGPIMQGMAKPINDLSRGCSSEDIVNMVAITALQSGN
ncbi:phosphate acetyltransferase [bacterium]|jgi:phosphate acetyltransferase|nr:phosphate acetyltransferase [bacterium]